MLVPSVKCRKVIYPIRVSFDTSPITPHALLESAGTHAVHLGCHVLPNPLIPFLPFLVLQTDCLSLIPHQLTSAILPRFLPAATAAVPACFAHQADQRFLLRPALLFRHAGEIRRAIATRVQGEGYADAVRADSPVVGITGGRRKVRKERYVDGEVWK